MRRILAVLTRLISGTLIASSIWMLCYPAVTPLIVSGATDVQVVTAGQRQISYRAPGPPYAWYVTVARTLETSSFRPLNR